MRLNLTIKRMLIGLVLTGVSVVILLFVINLLSNIALIDSQNRLTMIVLPLESANQKIRVAMANFIERQGRIAGARTPEELEQLGVRKHLEDEFNKSLELLEKLSAKEEDAQKKIKRLQDIYADFLNKDNLILESVRKVLKLEKETDARIAMLDDARTQVYKDSDTLSAKINFEAKREKVALRGYFEMKDKPEEMDKAVRELLKEDLTRMQELCSDLRLGLSSLFSYGWQILLAKSPENIISLKGGDILSEFKRVRSVLDALKKGGENSPDRTAMIAKIEKGFADIRTALSDSDTSLTELRRQWLEEQHKVKEIRALLKASIVSISGGLEGLQVLGEKVRNRAETEAAEVTRDAKRIVSFVSLIAIAFMALIGWLIIRRIAIPIEQAVNFADSIAKGDLTAKLRLEQSDPMTQFRLNRSDEISTLLSSLSDMALGLNGLIGQVQRSGEQVTSSAAELAASARQQEEVIKHQTESSKYVVSAVSEISKVSDELVGTVEQVAGMSQETAAYASTGQKDLSRMEEAIHRMETASRSISGKLEAINEKAANITSVVTTITKVADQTNLLSLNAAIEAEKAGEYGRGFTVVAREIRRLADQTAVSTLDIESMVREMQSAVAAGVMEMDAFIAEVRQSAEDIAKISTQLTLIIEQVKTLSPSFENVSQSIRFQSDSARDINTAMLNLSTEMEQTMESLGESFLAIEQLNEAARGLQDEVSRFKVF